MRALTLLLLAAAGLSAQRFYSDDPLEFEPKPYAVKDAANRKLSDYYDLLNNQFRTVGERQPKNGEPIRARSVNTMGEPLQGAWWQKRHYYERMSIEELKRIAPADAVPSMNSRWIVISIKNEGVTPGFTIMDANERMFYVKFDPMSNPEMATTADTVVSRFFWALGYHVPHNNLVYFKPEQLKLGADVTMPGKNGKPHKVTRADLLEILLKVYKSPNGTYRATASEALPGKPIGPPRYNGTRTDDPNDVVPHEHRRDQRGLHVIDAWLDHDDSRAINNLDALITADGIPYVKHYQLDFGSTLGSGSTRANSPRSGVYFFTWKSSARQLFTLGAAPPYWQFADYPKYASLGNFEWKVFDPERWVPEYHNPAFLNRLPDDEFWGAKLVTAFTDEEIQAIVSTGQLSDKKAEAWLVECLEQRRDKIGRVYFAKVLPLDKFTVDGGELSWVDLGASLKYLPAAGVSIQWFNFDNSSGARTPIGGQTSKSIPQVASGYSLAQLTDRATPSHKIDVILRHEGGVAKVVGLERYW